MTIVKINHFLDAADNPDGRFRTLRNIRFFHDNRGMLDFRTGSNGVIFRISVSGCSYAMKCYTKTDDNRVKRQQAVVRYLNSLNFSPLNKFKYMEEEMYVFDDLGRGCYRPVTMAEWSEGMTLRGWLAEKCRIRERNSIGTMADRFAALALELLEQEWAHGDLKPENIVVGPDGELRLIDYDSVFVPELAGESSPELGTPGFQHPERNAKFYDRHLDDYSIALISTSLYALEAFPEWYDETDDDRLPIDAERAVRGEDRLLHEIKSHWIDRGETALYRLAALCGSLSPVIPDLRWALSQALESRAGGKNGSVPESCPEIYRENGFYGYRTAQGNRLTEPVYDDAEEFSEGLALVRIGKRRYYIGVDGAKRIDLSDFDRAESFSEGLAVVCKGKKKGYLAPDGSLAIEPVFDEGRSFRQGLAAVKREGQWGYVDPKGAFVIGPSFDSAFDFREGVAVAGLGGKFGYIDRKGNWLADPVYMFASGVRNGMATVEKNGKELKIKFPGTGYRGMECD